jgi:hypothetical protein
MIVKEIKIQDENPYNRNGKVLQKKTRIYFFRAETLSANWARRFISPSREYRKFLPEVFDKLGLPADTVAKWNRYAGCSMCPCSPGFIVEGHYGKFVGVTIANAALSGE